MVHLSKNDAASIFEKAETKKKIVVSKGLRWFLINFNH